MCLCVAVSFLSQPLQEGTTGVTADGTVACMFRSVLASNLQDPQIASRADRGVREEQVPEESLQGQRPSEHGDRGTRASRERERVKRASKTFVRAVQRVDGTEGSGVNGGHGGTGAPRMRAGMLDPFGRAEWDQGRQDGLQDLAPGAAGFFTQQQEPQQRHGGAAFADGSQDPVPGAAGFCAQQQQGPQPQQHGGGTFAAGAQDFVLSSSRSSSRAAATTAGRWHIRGGRAGLRTGDGGVLHAAAAATAASQSVLPNSVEAAGQQWTGALGSFPLQQQGPQPQQHNDGTFASSFGRAGLKPLLRMGPVSVANDGPCTNAAAARDAEAK